MDQVIAKRYRLGAPLGAGGMARVVAARDMRLDRQVAIKLVPVSGIDRAGRERFVREARSAAGFSHPNAVAVYDGGEADGYLYLVMELVDGVSLADRLAEQGQLSIDEAVSITDSVLAALGAAHAAGIIHRDVKPGNILLGRTGEVKLADFGIAKRLNDAADLTGTGEFVGTPKYLAPEQVVGEPATPATDLYAVGVVLYEMLAGRPPYEGDAPLATAIAHRDAPIPDLRDARPDVPDQLAAAVYRVMAKDPADRFGSAEQMASALRSWPTPSPIVPAVPAADRPLEPTEVMVGPLLPARRSRAWWWAAAAGLLVGGGIALAVAQREQEPDGAAGTVGSTAAPASAAPATTAVPSTVAAVATAPTTAAGPATTTPLPASFAPSTVSELIAFVESDEFGKKTDDFLHELRKLEESDEDKQSKDAEDLLRKLDEWVAKDELSAELAPVTQAVLGPIAALKNDDDGGDD